MRFSRKMNLQRNDCLKPKDSGTRTTFPLKRTSQYDAP